jgi:hypothetical protein
MKVFELTGGYDTDHLTPDQLAELDVLFPPPSHPRLRCLLVPPV